MRKNEDGERHYCAGDLGVRYNHSLDYDGGIFTIERTLSFLDICNRQSGSSIKSESSPFGAEIDPIWCDISLNESWGN
jgi:hypothetical protein